MDAPGVDIGWRCARAVSAGGGVRLLGEVVHGVVREKGPEDGGAGEAVDEE